MSATSSVSTAMLRAEIIGVGTELLMGEVINSNAAYLSQELARLGIDVFYHTAVGDNPARIQDVFRQALTRSNLLMVTGGLGPTDDDLTVQTLAELFGAPMIADAESEVQIQRFFISRGMPMSRTNLKQARRPEDARPIFNRMGTAPGLYWDVTVRAKTLGWSDGSPRLILAFPGVPREMKAMWTEEAKPQLLSKFPVESILVSTSLNFFGIGESLLGEKLQDLMAMPSPTVSPYVGQAEVRIRIAAKAPTEDAAREQIEPIRAEILKRVGEYYFGENADTLELAVGRLLAETGQAVSVAESCTGGLLSSRLTDVPGSSDYVLFNTVTYSNEAKIRELDVPAEILAASGAVSEPVAARMAEGILNRAQTDIGLSITGIAGPSGGSDEKPVGLAYVGLARRGETPIVRKVLVNPQYERQYIKHWFTQYALHYLRQLLLGQLR